MNIIIWFGTGTQAMNYCDKKVTTSNSTNSVWLKYITINVIFNL